MKLTSDHLRVLAVIQRLNALHERPVTRAEIQAEVDRMRLFQMDEETFRSYLAGVFFLVSDLRGARQS